MAQTFRPPATQRIYDVCVVGSQLGGVVAGALLARRGFRVLHVAHDDAGFHYADHGYVLDPHGAVAYRALADYLQERPASRGIFLETAHPVKFDSVEKILGISPEIPESVSQLESRPKRSTEVRNDYSEVKELLLSKI